MFSPNVWSFEPPNSLITTKIDELTEKCVKQTIKRIQSHPFNKLISIVIPDVRQVPDSIAALFRDTDHYVAKELSLNEFIRKPFIEAFIKRGKFNGLSAITRIDVDDCVAISPEGILHLSVTKDVYHYLGLEGKVAEAARLHENRYTIRIDLKSKELVTSSKLYERIQRAFSNELLPKFNIQFTWTPPSSNGNESICPSSVAKYFADLGYVVDLVQTDCRTSIEYGLNVPLLGAQTDKPVEVDGNEKFYASEHELIEYVGMLALSCSFETKNFMNSWRCDGHTIEVGYATTLHVSGMFTIDTIKDVFSTLCEYVKEHKDIPWVSLYCHGFPHSPISFSNREHTFGANGDNSYALIVNPESLLLYYEVLSSNKQN